MSCCQGCRSGMGCDSGLDGLYGLAGLYGLMGQLLKAGSVMRVGVAYNYESTSAGVEAENQGPSWLRSAILTQLQALGLFSSINVNVQPPAYLNVQDGYITIQITLSDDQSEPQNVDDMVQYAITAYAPGISISRIEHAIDYVAPGSVAQPTPQPQPQPLPAPATPSQCNWNTMRWYDYAACQLGITSPIGGIAAGTFGGLAVAFGAVLLGLVIVKKL